MLAIVTPGAATRTRVALTGVAVATGRAIALRRNSDRGVARLAPPRGPAAWQDMRRPMAP